MKKLFFYVVVLLMGLNVVATSCSENDPATDNTTNTDTNTDSSSSSSSSSTETSAADINCTSSNLTSWANYMRAVIVLLYQDAANLYDDWTSSTSYGGTNYGAYFKAHNSSDYASAVNCIEQIVQGCIDIATEVGDAKIGDPIQKYNDNQITAALYAVESWYSWHSIDDYSNNILSIRNAYYGTRDGSVSENSISKFVETNKSELNTTVVDAINAAYDAIQNIPAPFRNNINSAEAVAAQEACLNLSDILDKQLKPYLTAITDKDTEFDNIISTYVDDVVVPTYADLDRKVNAFYTTILNFYIEPSDANFTLCAEAWLAAREPWETSEAFLFGPVSDRGLDPNMDSWPLDQDAIVQMLNSGNYSDMEWTGDYVSEEDEDISDEDAARAAQIASAQSVRGFHTLEFLIFKDGKARTIVTE